MRLIEILLRKWLHGKYPDANDASVRKVYGTCSSIIGICCNILLFLIKYAVGTLSGSIAIVSDAFNNLSDCASCLVTLFGYRLAAKPADKEHPFGHGRMEYFASLGISVIIALMGFELLRNAVEKLVHPQPVVFHVVTLLVLLLSIGVKFWMMYFNTVLGKRIRATAMLATAKDSRNDAIATSVTALALVTSLVTDAPVDGIVGIGVSLVILKSAVDIIRETVSDLLGRPAEPEVVQKLKELVLSKPGIEGVHDILIHNYGAGNQIGSCHVEVRSDADFVTIHGIVDMIEREIYETMRIRMTIHMDPIELNNVEVDRYRALAQQILKSLDPALSLHDFRMVPGEKNKRLVFDVVMPFSCSYTEEEIEAYLCAEIQKADPTCTASIWLEHDYT